MLKNYIIGQRRPINPLEQTGFLNSSRLRVKAAALPPALEAHLALLIKTKGCSEGTGEKGGVEATSSMSRNG